MSTPILEPTSYLASLGPLTDVPIIDGTLSLDEKRVPYASGTVTVALADIPDLDDVDPRGMIRAEVIASDGTTTRDFDLSVQSLEVDENRGTATFTLASDEALLQQYTALSDDLTVPQNPFTSVVQVNDYVLGEVTGASLTAVDNVSLDIRADSENLIRNPRVGVNVADWVQVGGLLTTRYTSGGPDPTLAPTYFGFQAGGAGSATAQVFFDQNAVSITAGKKYVLSVAVYADGARQMRLDGVMFDGTNNPVNYTPTATVTPASTWQRIEVTFEATPGTARLRPRVTPVGGLAGSEYIRVSAWRLSEWTGGGLGTDSVYFDGAFPDTSIYDHSWIDGAHASISRRQVVNPLDPSPEETTWYTGMSAWDYLLPINTLQNRRLWCDEDRLWRCMNPDTWTVAGTITITGMNATEAANVVALGNPDEYATGVIVRYVWTSLDGTQNEVLDVAGTEAQVRQVTLNSPYPGRDGAAQAILDRMVGRGAVLTLTALADYLATPGKTASVTIPGRSTVNLRLSSVEWDLNSGLMRVGTRAVI